MQSLTKEQIDSFTLNYQAFSSTVLKKDLRPYQLAPARSIISSTLQRKAETFSLLLCRQSGKTETLSTLAIWLATTFPGIRIGYYAPTFRQAIDIMMLRTKSYLNADYFSGMFDINRGNMVVFKPMPEVYSPFSKNNIGGSLIGASSADVSSKIEGATWDLLLIDESQDIDRRVLDVSLLPMLTATEGTLVMAGTPFSIDCGFYDTIQAIKDKKLPGKNYHIDYKVVSKFYPEYETIVKRAIAKSGEDSVSFRTQYGVQWVGGLGLFFEYDRYLSLGNKELPLLYYPIEGQVYVAGLDIGGSSQNSSHEEDESVLTFSQVASSGKIRLAAIFRWKGENHNIVREEIFDLLKIWAPIGISVDTTGIGQNIGDDIESSGLVSYVFKVPFTPHTKSAIGYNADSAFRTGLLEWPAKSIDETIKDFNHQCRWLVRDISQSKRMNWYVDEIHGHDDIVSSWFLSLWTERSLKNEGLMYNDFILPTSQIRTAKEFSRTHFGVE